MNGDLMLANYRMLIKSLNDHARRVARDYADHMQCRKGCDGCCQHLSLFWVEGFALFDALRQKPAAKAAEIKRRLGAGLKDCDCPLLEEHGCLLYEARPVICRTHGLPLMNGTGEERALHYCPENFRNLETLPGDAVLDMEVVNASLATINTLFVAEFFGEGPRPSAERHMLADFLCGPAEQWFVDRIGHET